MIAVILFFVAIVVFVIIFGVWGNSLDKREKGLKQKEFELQKKEAELNLRKAHLDAVQDAQCKSEKQQDTERAVLVEWREKLTTWEQVLGNKAAELDKREQEFDIHKASVKADGTLGEKVATAVEERIKKPKKAKK